MKQPLEVVLLRLNAFRREFSDDYDTFHACFEHVVRTSGWMYMELVREIRGIWHASRGTSAPTGVTNAQAEDG